MGLDGDAFRGGGHTGITSDYYNCSNRLAKMLCVHLCA